MFSSYKKRLQRKYYPADLDPLNLPCDASEFLKQTRDT